MSTKVARNGFTIIRIDDQPLPDEQPKFLVDGLIARSLTLLYGRPKCGKSTVAMALSVALANGHKTFLGRTVNLDGPARVGIIAGDPGDDGEYARALSGLVPPDDTVHAYSFARPPQVEHWQEAITELRHWGAKVVIIDNLSSFCRDPNESRMVSPILDRCDQLMRAGIAVVLVHHVSEKSGQNGPSTTPLGHTSISAAARWKVRTQLPATGPLRLVCEGNYSAPHEIVLSRPEGKPSFQVLSTADADELTERREQRRRERDKATMDANAKVATWLAAHPGVSQREAARRMTADLGFEVSQSRVKRVIRMNIPAGQTG